jgi:hypothetical protein
MSLDHWVEVGTKVETEHTKDRAKARKIALQHLAEDEDYYKDWKAKEKVLFRDKVSKSDDGLQDLVNSIRKSATAPTRQVQAPAASRPVHHRGGVSVVKGEGGLVFNFGGMTGNPIADNATRMLNLHSDPVQAQIANYQRESFAKSLVEFVRTGADPVAESPSGGVHPEWGQQFSKSLDQQVVEGIKNGQIPVEGGMPGAPGQQITGDFNKSRMVLNGEEIVGQSETDAAVIEMMKSMPQPEPGEDVIDATEL